MTHILGPWAYDGPSHNIHVFEADRPHMRVCFLTSDGPTEANARLIAAAPELLKWCEALVDELERRGVTSDRCGALLRARETIAQAKGQRVAADGLTFVGLIERLP